jgi:hypothetical protein
MTEFDCVVAGVLETIGELKDAPGPGVLFIWWEEGEDEPITKGIPPELFLLPTDILESVLLEMVSSTRPKQVVMCLPCMMRLSSMGTPCEGILSLVQEPGRCVQILTPVLQDGTLGESVPSEGESFGPFSNLFGEATPHLASTTPAEA